MCVSVCVSSGCATSTQQSKERSSSDIPASPAEIYKTSCELEKVHYIFPPTVIQFYLFCNEINKSKYKKANDTPLYFSIVKQAAYFKNYWLSHTTANYKLQIYEIKGGRIMSHY